MLSALSLGFVSLVVHLGVGVGRIHDASDVHSWRVSDHVLEEKSHCPNNDNVLPLFRGKT